MVFSLSTSLSSSSSRMMQADRPGPLPAETRWRCRAVRGTAYYIKLGWSVPCIGWPIPCEELLSFCCGREETGPMAWRAHRMADLVILPACMSQAVHRLHTSKGHHLSTRQYIVSNSTDTISERHSAVNVKHGPRKLHQNRIKSTQIASPPRSQGKPPRQSDKRGTNQHAGPTYCVGMHAQYHVHVLRCGRVCC